MNNKIREFRKLRGMSQRDLAMQVGITRQTVGLIETFKYNPSLKVCLKIADVLGTGLDELFNPKYFDEEE
ncbi:helix-turn-helix transcriptional regulator [Lentilactobacillus sp. Marseille-Q4993]|uniref:helix-turn-helix transcriptional regulator n=1 Tax=Lentilactobacillus sp. Marseille-Q4993 TaxID=3039492 RepID=UPI0024BC634F|nr:helix-turn-helix transcriptional regulator [Lentilactobacillus sp. Marseille-Q4993]